jgi:SAM-dependent methyltransferase
MKSEAITNAVEEHYAAVARGEASCCGAPAVDVARSIGYSDDELALAGDANLGLGCGNPLALTEIKPGMTVLDLGSGAGFDAFLAWPRVGPTGRVIGIDMTDDMLALAHANAEKRGATNVEFRKGRIEQLPLESGTVDYVISNCVINLSADKPAVFREIARVLKPGGQFAVSDIVLLRALPEQLASDVSAYVGCIAGASRLTEYLSIAAAAGLRDLSVPRISLGRDMVKLLAPKGFNSGKQVSCCGTIVSGDSLDHSQDLVQQAAEALASIKLHGRK